MKKNRYLLFLAFAVVGGLLTACAGGAQVASSWPGVTVDVNNETAYLANGTELYAINLSNGSEKWRFPVEADNKITFYAAPGLADSDQVIVVGYNHVVYSVDPATGSQKWAHTGAKDRFIASPLINESGIYAPAADNFLYALDFSGNLRWTFETEHSQWGTPAMDGGLIYLPSLDHHVYALDSQSGKLVWKTEDLGGAIVGSPTLSPTGVLYIGTLGSEMLALDAKDGSVVWRLSTSGWVWSGPLLRADILYFGDLDGSLYSVDAKDGSLVWTIQPNAGPDYAIAGTPLILGDTLYYGSANGNFSAVDPVNGSPRWNKTFTGKIYQSPLAAGDRILLAPLSGDALLMALDQDGNQVWAFNPAK
jgi:outer membrane protein assembly factor BamB